MLLDPHTRAHVRYYEPLYRLPRLDVAARRRTLRMSERSVIAQWF
jgi:hypothetical protein